MSLPGSSFFVKALSISSNCITNHPSLWSKLLLSLRKTSLHHFQIHHMVIVNVAFHSHISSDCFFFYIPMPLLIHLLYSSLHHGWFAITGSAFFQTSMALGQLRNMCLISSVTPMQSEQQSSLIKPLFFFLFALHITFLYLASHMKDHILLGVFSF